MHRPPNFSEDDRKLLFAISNDCEPGMRCLIDTAC